MIPPKRIRRSIVLRKLKLKDIFVLSVKELDFGGDFQNGSSRIDGDGGGGVFWEFVEEF